jgi:hypothetical protein
MTDIVIVLKQRGVVRPLGYQVTQWCALEGATVTDPSTYAGLFVLRNTLGRESFVRIATLQDLEQYPLNELRYFEARGTNGGALVSQATAGDVLRFADNALLHWEQDEEPYDTRDFIVNAVYDRKTGSSPQILSGNSLLLPSYVFSSYDVGRWVYLSGFSTSAYNGYAQILSYAGDVAQIDKVTTTTETGTSYAFRWIQVDDDVGAGLEKRYFPTKVDNAGWQLLRSGASVTSNNSGGMTQRETEDATFRSSRVTTLETTADFATKLMAACRSGVGLLQATGAINGTTFSLTTTVYGP